MNLRRQDTCNYQFMVKKLTRINKEKHFCKKRKKKKKSTIIRLYRGEGDVMVNSTREFIIIQPQSGSSSQREQSYF